MKASCRAWVLPCLVAWMFPCGPVSALTYVSLVQEIEAPAARPAPPTAPPAAPPTVAVVRRSVPVAPPDPEPKETPRRPQRPVPAELREDEPPEARPVRTSARGRRPENPERKAALPETSGRRRVKYRPFAPPAVGEVSTEPSAPPPEVLVIEPTPDAPGPVAVTPVSPSARSGADPRANGSARARAGQGHEWAQIGVYGMNYDTDLVGPLLSMETPSGGGNILNVETGLGGPWSVGYSRIGVGGDLPGFQADAHVNFALRGQWAFQLATSMGELRTGKGGPVRNDFTGVSYSLIKGFRLSRQWRFQASYTNVPVRAYEGGFERPIRSRLGYHLLTVSYSPEKDESLNRWSIDAGLLRLEDIRPIGFSYLYAGLSYRFQVPRLIDR